MHFQLRRAAPPVVTFGSGIPRAIAIAVIAFSAASARAALTPSERYVTLAYFDLLGRGPGPSELASFAGGLDNMTLSRTAFASAILGSAEFNDDKAISFFSLLLHRSSTTVERAPYVSLLQGGQTFEFVEGNIAGSAEYFANRGGSTNDGFLDAVFSDFLARPIQPAERLGYDGALTSGTTREQVADSILGSSEYRADTVGRDYNALLRRNPTPLESNNLVSSGLDDRSIVKLLVAGDEYFNLAQSIPEPAAASGLVLLLSACLRRRRGGKPTA
jgi:hypothetical protein